MWAGLLCPSRAFGHHCKRRTTDLPRLQYASLLQLSICARLQRFSYSLNSSTTGPSLFCFKLAKREWGCCSGVSASAAPQPIRLNSIKLNDIFYISVHKFLDFKFTFV